MKNRLTTEDVRIVSADRSHLRAIPAIEQAAAGLIPARDLPDPLRYEVTDRVTLLAAQRDGLLWVALDGADTVVGFAMATVIDGNAHLDELDVLPDHGRRGIGTRLLQAVIDHSREQGFRRLTLVTFGHLPWNAPFYAKAGFGTIQRRHYGGEMREIIEEERVAGLNVDDRVVMVKVLQ
jgi:GNAT superfamily N-acetyltransferase